jgi:low temperature requirement protein LtrA
VAEPDRATTAGTPTESAVRVSTLELFFDLVFVFTLTQLTDVLAHDIDVGHAGQILVMLGVIWWMYSGYAWLTNAVAPSSTIRRTLLLTGMAGFFVIALAIPGAFHGDGWAFGAAYLLVNLVHTVLFIRGANLRTALVMRRIAPLNLLSALLVLAGGIATGPARPALWAAALALQIVTPYVHRLGWHSIIAGHFVERHGLVVIVAIGESIVAIGLGFAGLRLDAGAITVAVLGLCIAYYLWWAYFAGDDVRAEHALDAITDPRRKAIVALRGWGYAHYLLIAGIVALAAGVKKAVGHAFEPLGWAPATAVGAGAALYLVGHAWFVRILRIGGARYRLAAAAAVLATIPLGHVVAVAQLAAVPLIMAAALIAEDVPRVRRAGNTAIHTFGRTADDPTHRPGGGA